MAGYGRSRVGGECRIVKSFAMQKFIVHYSGGTGQNPGGMPSNARPGLLTMLAGGAILVTLAVVAFFALTIVLVIAAAAVVLVLARLLVKRVFGSLATPKAATPLSRTDGRVNVRVVRPDERDGSDSLPHRE